MKQSSRLILRKALPLDCRDVWAWRNDPTSRKYSMDTSAIPFRAHELWFRKSLKDPKRRIYIATLGGSKVGMLRHDFSAGGVIAISLNVNPSFRNRGIGLSILCLSVRLARKHYPRHIQKAVIRSGNTISEKIFLKAGFLKIHEVARPAYAIWIRC